MEFQRDFSFSVKNQGQNQVLVTSIMKDKYHDVLLQVQVVTPELKITEVMVEFGKSPTPKCPLIQERLQNLVGVVIGKGLTKAIYNVLGGSEGCTNLRNMLITSLPLVLNIVAAQGSKSDEEILAKIEDGLVGTCVGYSSLGELTE